MASPLRSSVHTPPINLDDNLGAIGWKLDVEVERALDEASRIDIGYPQTSMPGMRTRDCDVSDVRLLGVRYAAGNGMIRP